LNFPRAAATKNGRGERKENAMSKGALIAAAGRSMLRKSPVSVAAAAMLAALLVQQTALATAAEKAKAPPKASAKAALPTNKPSGQPKRSKGKDLQHQDRLGNFDILN
jgi:hypothetical protein